mmetsp:Transcript_35241/g.59156  ORF Transcript_35241/g.59156 Transcript_35241/m.59156 type:complete len:451 (-) Transcript_35241:1189-2541(-)
MLHTEPKQANLLKSENDAAVLTHELGFAAFCVASARSMLCNLNLEALARLTVLLHLLRGVARIVEDVAKGNVPSELIDHTFIHVCLERLIIHIGVESGCRQWIGDPLVPVSLVSQVDVGNLACRIVAQVAKADKIDSRVGFPADVEERGVRHVLPRSKHVRQVAVVPKHGRAIFVRCVLVGGKFVIWQKPKPVESDVHVPLGDLVGTPDAKYPGSCQWLDVLDHSPWLQVRLVAEILPNIRHGMLPGELHDFSTGDEPGGKPVQDWKIPDHRPIGVRQILAVDGGNERWRYAGGQELHPIEAHQVDPIDDVPEGFVVQRAPHKGRDAVRASVCDLKRRWVHLHRGPREVGAVGGPGIHLVAPLVVAHLASDQVLVFGAAVVQSGAVGDAVDWVVCQLHLEPSVVRQVTAILGVQDVVDSIQGRQIVPRKPYLKGPSGHLLCGRLPEGVDV